jgi:hypothetical protein
MEQCGISLYNVLCILLMLHCAPVDERCTAAARHSRRQALRAHGNRLRTDHTPFKIAEKLLRRLLRQGSLT